MEQLIVLRMRATIDELDVLLKPRTGDRVFGLLCGTVPDIAGHKEEWARALITRWPAGETPRAQLLCAAEVHRFLGFRICGLFVVMVLCVLCTNETRLLILPERATATRRCFIWQPTLSYQGGAEPFSTLLLRAKTVTLRQKLEVAHF